VATIIAAIIAVCSAVVVAWLTRRLKISEFRQAWIIDLRKDVADYLGVTQRWFKSYADGEEHWKSFAMGNEAGVILARIKMRINPNENKYKKEDDEFIASLEQLRNPYSLPKEDAQTHWARASEDIVAKARLLLKREWEVTKRMGMFDPLPPSSWPSHR
jgi:hypothetical protein